jgi:hypothetical protein
MIGCARGSCGALCPASEPCRQASRSSQFLEACRAFNKGELPEDRLQQTTVRLGFNNVIDAFHVVGSVPVPVRFFADERGTGASPAIRLTDDLRRLAASVQGAALSAEAESRWRLVETALQLNLPGPASPRSG